MENSGRTLAINLAPICHAFVYIYRNDPISIDICCYDDSDDVNINIWKTKLCMQ